MNVSICVGSACHMKGSKEVIAKLKELIAAHGLQGRVLLNGSFCTGNCEYAVCVVIDDTVFSVRPETTEEFFNNEILPRVS
ncbi:MAG: (2Fe-2S) ferredoxin domain-containing protein [Oscillospiraceae bacterium]|nr:(2Fe-2S) ferredoxin domain-containing protein [Oscillospiraceae bacterium]